MQFFRKQEWLQQVNVSSEQIRILAHMDALGAFSTWCRNDRYCNRYGNGRTVVQSSKCDQVRTDREARADM